MKGIFGPFHCKTEKKMAAEHLQSDIFQSIGQTGLVSQEWQMYIPNTRTTDLPNLTLEGMKALKLLC